VVEDVPAGSVAVGVPAKVLGQSKVKEPAKHMQQVRARMRPPVKFLLCFLKLLLL
jgi:serine acetyltransferase